MNHPYLIMEIEIAKGSHISYIVRLTELFGSSTSFDDKYRSAYPIWSFELPTARTVSDYIVCARKMTRLLKKKENLLSD